MDKLRRWAVAVLAVALWAVPVPAEGGKWEGLGPLVKFSGRVLAVVDNDRQEIADGPYARDYLNRSRGWSFAFKASTRPPGPPPSEVMLFVDGDSAGRHADAVGVRCPEHFEQFCWTLRPGQRVEVAAEVVSNGELAFGSYLVGRRVRVLP